MILPSTKLDNNSQGRLGLRFSFDFIEEIQRVVGGKGRLCGVPH